MPDQKHSTRRKFLRFLGLSAGASLITSTAFGRFIKEEDIKRLKPDQRTFMLRYGEWMDEFIEVIRIEKANPGNLENNQKKMALAERALEMKPELSEFMKDETFALIYTASIQRMSSEI
jgi:hypothetical protein